MNRNSRRPWALWGVAGAVSFLVLLPVLFLLLQASEGGALLGLKRMLRGQFLVLVSNTLWLMLAVLFATVLIALPLAWLTTRVELPAQRLWSLLCILPLAIPTYMMAYVYLSVGGHDGLLAQWFGWKIKRISGFWGAWWVLTLCNLPYLFLNLRAGFLYADPALEEASRSLGAGRWETFWRVQLPQLWPAIGAGCLLVGLHVLGNFEAVSLVRYKTLSWELFQVRMLDRQYAALISLAMLGLTIVALWMEARFLRNLRLVRVGSGSGRHKPKAAPGIWRWPGLALLALVGFVGVIVPVGAILFWFAKGAKAAMAGDAAQELTSALVCSLQSSLPTALATTMLALPLVYLGVRYPSWLSRVFERISYFGYAIAPIALALSLIFATLRLAPSMHLTLPLLVLGLVIHFLAEALGPVRSGLLQSPPRLEEAARSLGSSRLGTFFRVTLPCLRRGLVVSAALVFLSCMKELSLHLILSPSGYSSLAMEVWDRVENVEYASAAPYALTILICSGLFVLLLQDDSATKKKHT